MNNTKSNHQFIYDEHGHKAFAVIPIEDYETAFGQPLDAESQRWLEADLGEDLPEYDWGEPGIPQDKPIRYEPGVGFIVVGGK